MSSATRRVLGQLTLLFGAMLTLRGLLIADRLKDIYLYGGLTVIVIGGWLVADFGGKGQR